MDFKSFQNKLSKCLDISSTSDFEFEINTGDQNGVYYIAKCSSPTFSVSFIICMCVCVCVCR